MIVADADVNATDGDGRMALVGAAYYRHIVTVKALIDADANVNVTDGDGNTALARVHIGLNEAEGVYYRTEKSIKT